jgi:hypothetical protein
VLTETLHLMQERPLYRFLAYEAPIMFRRLPEELSRTLAKRRGVYPHADPACGRKADDPRGHGLRGLPHSVSVAAERRADRPALRRGGNELIRSACHQLIVRDAPDIIAIFPHDGAADSPAHQKIPRRFHRRGFLLRNLRLSRRDTGHTSAQAPHSMHFSGRFRTCRRLSNRGHGAFSLAGATADAIIKILLAMVDFTSLTPRNP